MKKIWKGKEFSCEVCDKIFLSRHKNVRFCSDKCRGIKCNNFLKNGEPWNKKENKIRYCLICGKKFHSQTRTGYCRDHYYTDDYKKTKFKYTNGEKIKNYDHTRSKSKRGKYNGYKCDSSWELAWIIYHLENHIYFERNTDGFEYIYNEQKYLYYPDFKTIDGYVEIKGYLDDKSKEKINQFPLPLKIYYKNDMTYIFNYIKEKYGKDYVKLYDDKEFKEKIIKKIHIKRYCEKCGNIISNKNKSGFCINCYERHKKFDVTKDELEKLIIDHSYVQIGKIFGVSDNSIIKRLKKFKIYHKK